jgi:hypothetical protein
MGLPTLVAVPVKLGILVFALVFAIYMSKLTCCAAMLSSELGMTYPGLGQRVLACTAE